MENALPQADFSDLVRELREQPEASGAMTPKSRESKSYFLSQSQTITGKTRSMPPLKTPQFHPHQLMLSHFRPDELSAIAGLLARYQRDGHGWDEWRIKNWPAGIEERWNALVRDCLSNGFIHPTAHDGRITWHQILTRDKIMVADDCLLCPVPHTECRGSVRRNVDRKELVPCWHTDGQFGV